MADTKKGYLVASWSSKCCYLASLGQWVELDKHACFFLSLAQAIHAAECHSYFSCHHLEVVYCDVEAGILDTVYRTEYPNKMLAKL